jgi:hypothetical protein
MKQSKFNKWIDDTPLWAVILIAITTGFIIGYCVVGAILVAAFKYLLYL